MGNSRIDGATIGMPPVPRMRRAVSSARRLSKATTRKPLKLPAGLRSPASPVRFEVVVLLAEFTERPDEDRQVGPHRANSSVVFVTRSMRMWGIDALHRKNFLDAFE
jgi:hypothetical protein